MDRAPRARRRLPVILLILLTPALIVLPVAFASASSAAEGPPITFTATGTQPVVCGSRPDVSALLVKTGTKIVIANQTGVASSVRVNGESVQELQPGVGAVIKLKAGQHEIRLIPHCAVITETTAAVVNVVPGELLAPTPTPTPAGGPPSPGPSPGEADTGPVTVLVAPETSEDARPTTASPATTASATRSTRSSAAAVTAGPSGSPVAVAATRDGGSAGSGGSAVDGTRESAVIDVRSIPLGDPSDPKRGRLLAVIAAICVFGVTAAIIRAIVSQRTSSVIPL